MTSIAEISKEFGLSAYTLRFYEKEGLMSVPRNNSGIRDYDDESRRRINAVVHYRRAGVTLAQIKEIFKTGHDQNYHLQILNERKAALQQELTELQQTLDFLDHKIGMYTGNDREKASVQEELPAEVLA